MALHYEIDNTDLQILNILMEDAFTPYTEIGKKLYISLALLFLHYEF